MLTVVLAVIMGGLSVVWAAPFLLSGLLGLRLQRLVGARRRALAARVRWAAVWADDDRPDQWVAGWPFVGYARSESSGQHGGRQQVLYLLAPAGWLRRALAAADGGAGGGPAATATLLERTGPFWRLEYERRPLALPAAAPTADQAWAVGRLAAGLARSPKRSVVALLHGPPRTGKSFVPLLLARRLAAEGRRVALVDSFNPAEPNDCFAALYAAKEPGAVLVVVLEEADGLVAAMHAGVEPHRHLPIQVRCKADWCKWLDHFDRGYYPDVALLLTTNREAAWFDALDPAYCDAGRVDLRLRFDERVPATGGVGAN